MLVPSPAHYCCMDHITITYNRVEYLSLSWQSVLTGDTLCKPTSNSGDLTSEERWIDWIAPAKKEKQMSHHVWHDVYIPFWRTICFTATFVVKAMFLQEVTFHLLHIDVHLFLVPGDGFWVLTAGIQLWFIEFILFAAHFKFDGTRPLRNQLLRRKKAKVGVKPKSCLQENCEILLAHFVGIYNFSLFYFLYKFNLKAQKIHVKKGDELKQCE